MNKKINRRDLAYFTGTTIGNIVVVPLDDLTF